LTSRIYPYRAYLIIFLSTLISSGLLGWAFFGDQDRGFWLLFSLLIFLLSTGFTVAGWWIIRKRDRVVVYQLTRVLRTFDAHEHVTLAGIPFFPGDRAIERPLKEIIRRLQANYQANKQFTQNTSHELQTPLAIIKGNIEMLLQSEKLTKGEVSALGTILKQTNRLSRLNSGLALLAKIETQGFSDDEPVDLQATAEDVIEHFSDLIQARHIEIRRRFRSELRVLMSASLAEIMLANLVQNAIRHNVPEKSYVDLRIDEGTLWITNPGATLDEEPETLFERFKRHSAKEDSLGLGLSIVQHICERYEFDLAYLYRDGLHTLRIQFGNAVLPERGSLIKKARR
jgi:signal transduction histidine kinase